MKKQWSAILLMLLMCLTMGVSAAEDYVLMGSYEQDNNSANGMEPIEWIVLKEEDGRQLLLSRYCLDTQVYHIKKVGITWDKCTLRQWLNNDFYSTVFTPEEQAKILTVSVPNFDLNDRPVENTDERVFLLSKEEVLEIYPEMAQREAKPTAYCVARGCYVAPETGNCWWWLRSAGVRPVDASGVRADGRVSGYGSRDVNRPSGSIRPVIWVETAE